MESTMNSSEANNAPQQAPASSSEGLSGAAMSALGYFFALVAILSLCIEPYNKDAKVRFNAMQAILVQVAYVLFFIVVGITSAIVTAILSAVFSYLDMPSLLALLLGVFPIISLLGMLAMFGTSLYLIVSAAKGGTPQLPVISNMARKFVGKA